MEQHTYTSRQEYLDSQVIRSQRKMEYCKVYFYDLFRYQQLIHDDLLTKNKQVSSQDMQPILCLGVRSGAEVDMFRSVFFGPLLKQKFWRRSLFKQDTTTEAESKIALARRFGWGAGSAEDGRVKGVEVNPDAARPDVHIGSYDELPDNWAGKYRILYSNSFDHSMDPEKTAASWRKVAAPGAYVIIAFVHNAAPSETDPLGGLTLERMEELWQAPVVFSSQTLNRNGYHEICFRL